MKSRIHHSSGGITLWYNCKAIFLILSFCLINSFSSIGQSITPIDGSVVIDSLTVFYVELPDTVNIASIEVGLGHDQNTTDIILREFIFDESNGLPSGLSYLRVANKVWLTLGNLGHPSAWFATIRIKNVAGVWGDSFSFIGN